MTEEVGYIESIHKLGRRIFVHTINDFNQITYYIDNQIDGFYSDFVTESDLENHEQVIKE